MLRPGEPIPDAVVWRAPRRAVSLRGLSEGRPFLLFFYLFDWTST